jgi:UDP-N-acetyl-D-mannosaminuronic acid dehydrogenase
MNKTICVVGLGYIGLPTASLLATKGYTVTGVDIHENIINTINQGRIHIVEPELDILVKSAIQSKKLKASLVPVPADIFIIAVPTPFKANHEPNLSFIEQAVKTISPYIKSNDIIILESTSPVGTTEQISSWIKEERGESDDLLFAHCPERVLPGSIMRELIENDRLVGGLSVEATEKVSSFYETFVSGRILKTDARTAEMTKLVENSYRDVNIAYANELSIICEELDIDVWEMIKLANHHPRVNILQPGPGVGGHCIAVDPWFIIHKSPKNSRLIHTARYVNDLKSDWIFEKIRKIADRFKNPVICCLGLAYKKDIDDLRESPALKIVKQIKMEALGKLIVCEPNIKEQSIDGIAILPLQEAIDQADIVIILVNHIEFMNLSIDELHEIIIFDTCGALQN